MAGSTALTLALALLVAQALGTASAEDANYGVHGPSHGADLPSSVVQNSSEATNLGECTCPNGTPAPGNCTDGVRARLSAQQPFTAVPGRLLALCPVACFKLQL